MDLLTKQEELFLLTIHRLAEPAYLVNIREHLLKFAGKDWAFGSLYITLDKLRKKGFVETYTGKPSSIRGGKAIKYYKLTGEGRAALAEAKKVQDVMWQGFTASMAEKNM